MWVDKGSIWLKAEENILIKRLSCLCVCCFFFFKQMKGKKK